MCKNESCAYCEIGDIKPTKNQNVVSFPYVQLGCNFCGFVYITKWDNSESLIVVVNPPKKFIQNQKRLIFR